MRAKDISDDTNVELKHIPGPYLMMWRKIWLKELLQIQKDMNEAGHEIDLVRDEELQAIRQQWLRDPNEPDWPDSLPQLYSEVYPDTDFDWIENDAGVFTEHDTELLESLGEEHGVPAQLLMKLLEVEISAGGLGQRRGILNKLESVLRKDWDSLEEIKERKAETSEFDNWKDKLDELQQQYDGAAHL
jgi:DNA sulfur modification protein DndC